MFHTHSNKIGFTLIELSIVLVIIGLIVGGVLAGRTLIRASEMRNILTQKESYITAVNTFKGKFNALPGDMLDAQSIWGSASDCSVAQTTQATCNGNADNLIGASTPSGNLGNESFLGAEVSKS